MSKSQDSFDSQLQKAPLKAGGQGNSRTKGNLSVQCRKTKINSGIAATNSIVNWKSIRSKCKTVLQNESEQTFAKCQKRLKGGHAEDLTVQQDPEVVKYFSGGPPVYTFVDEIWRRGVEKKQEKYRENLRVLQIENKKFMKMQVGAGHRELMALVGPDWFQELSPNQLKAVDNLKNCILKDKKHKCITYTKDNIGELGLVLRPNQRHIKKALNNCCECPVEFLLILYQLMNQNRTIYSINDRLLLSAVAHLTMRETLKELHIRIPSPPPSPRKPSPVLEQPPQPRYKSPYLVTFNFVPCPRKYTGVYKNKHVQHPESPYFAYIAELKQERGFENDEKRTTYITRKQSGITVDQEKEIVTELKYAQKIYESLVDFEPVPYLLKPSIYIPCDHVAKLPEELVMGHEETELEENDLSLEVYTCDELCGMEEQVELEEEASEVLIAPDESIEQKDSHPKSVPEDEKLVVARVPSLGCTCKEDVEESIKTNLCQCAECTARRQELSTGTCECMAVYETKLQNYEKLRQRFDVQQGLMSMPKPYVVGGMTYTHDGQPVYLLSGIAPELECSCAAIHRDQVLEEQRLANMPTIPLGKQKYVISGVVHPTDEGNVFLVSSAVPTEDCACMELFKSYQERHVQCLEGYEKYLEKIQIDVREYMLEIANDPRFQEAEPPAIEEQVEESKPEEQVEESEPEEQVEEAKPEEQIEEAKPEEQVEESKAEDLTTMEMCSTVRSTSASGSGDVQLTIANDEQDGASMPKCECGPCSCCQTENAIQVECICTKPPPVCDEACGKRESEMSDLYRFIILDKMPSNYNDQMNILKKALLIMAEDGFPLAKLPDSWSLPIFRLWMDMRCRRYWTQEDRLTFYEKSMGHWNHLIYCDRSITEGARLDLSKQKARQYTWAHAYSVRKIAAAKENAYYREVKQVAINEAREFFPSTFSYELPTPNFRDCFFAYAPAKEDDCNYLRPWFPHEFKKR